MKDLGDALLTIAVLGGILVLSAVLTSLWVRVMYYRCKSCRTINARRRTHCRMCGEPLT